VELWLSERYRRSFQSSALAGLSIARADEKRLGGKVKRRRREDEERESRRRLEQDDQEQEEQQQQEQQEGDGERVRRRRRTMGFKEFGDHVGSQFSGTMGGVLPPEEEGFPTGLRLEMTVEMERMDLTEKERTIKSAIASGTLLAALKDGPDGALYEGVDIVFVSASSLLEPPPAFTIEEIQDPRATGDRHSAFVGGGDSY
jgi:hypothetical protein